MSDDETSDGTEIQLVADENGLAVFGAPSAVEQFLASEGLVASGPASTGLGVGRLRGLLGTGSAAAQAGSEIAANSGRWVKLSEESAKAMKKYGLRESSKSGLSTGVLKGDKGQIKGFVEFVRGPGAALTNPAMLAGAAGIMAQLAMQQTMDEITDYLQRIDAKLDDVLRAQKDSVVSRLTGAGMAIDEAMTVSRARGKVDEVTWSKVQNLTTTIAEVQGYALAQLDGLAGKLESADKVSDIASATAAAAAVDPGVAGGAGTDVPAAGGPRRPRARPGARRVPGRGRRPPARAGRGPAQAAHGHRCGHRATAGADHRRGGHRQREGPAAPEARRRGRCVPARRVSGTILDFHGLLGLESSR